ncbi:26187_t:CDS:1, partial [Gigaspora rosea]
NLEYDFPCLQILEIDQNNVFALDGHEHASKELNLYDKLFTELNQLLAFKID